MSKATGDGGFFFARAMQLLGLLGLLGSAGI